jgi:hypothetical protein
VSTPSQQASVSHRTRITARAARRNRQHATRHNATRTWHYGEGVVLDEPVEEAGDEGREHLHDGVDDGVHAADLPSPAQPHRQCDRCTGKGKDNKNMKVNKNIKK